MNKRMDEWISFSKKSNKSIFFYQDKVLDLTNFMSLHPGGKKALTNYLNKDITNIIFTVYPHKKENTLPILMKYVIGKIPKQDMRQHQKSTRSRSLTPVKQKKKVVFEADECVDQSQKPVDEGNKSSRKLKTSKSQKQFKTKQTSKQKKKKEKQRSKSKEKTVKKQKQNVSKQQKTEKDASQSINSDLDQEKPFFKVPILHTKNIFMK